jgi:ABC-2 type transport system ATP-binding protein
VLSVRALSRRFGDTLALDDVTFDVGPGRLTGFVGGNGAGKTTTMRIVMGVLAATSGEVLWNGVALTEQVRRTFGYMPEERGLYPKMRVADQLVFFARLHGLSADVGRQRADELLERLGLADRSGDALQTLSLGNQQRVQIAAALIHRPTALVLDEPFSGLDPMAVDSMTGLLADVDEAVPVLFSSHQLDLVERLCDRLVILDHGRIAAAGSPDDLRRRGPDRYRVVLADGADAGWLRDVAGLVVADVAGPTALLQVSDAEAPELLRSILDKAPVQEFSRVVPRLSEVFAQVVA